MLPKLRIMPATKAADCGVSSRLCCRSYRNGLAPSMYSLVQEIGRVDRNPFIDSSDCRFEVHRLFLCLVKLYVRIMQHPDPSERAVLLGSMIEVLALIVTLIDCQHTLIEKYFEDPSLMRTYEIITKPCVKYPQTARFILAPCCQYMLIARVSTTSRLKCSHLG